MFKIKAHRVYVVYKDGKPFYKIDDLPEEIADCSGEEIRKVTDAVAASIAGEKAADGAAVMSSDEVAARSDALFAALWDA